MYTCIPICTHHTYIPIYRYLTEETRISGLAPWHLRNRSHDQNGKSVCDMRLGAVAFPKLMDKWSAFGAEIANKTKLMMEG